MNTKDVRYIISNSVSKRKREYLDRRVDSSRKRNRVFIIKTYLRSRETYDQINKEKRVSLSNEHSRNRKKIRRMILSRTKNTRNTKEIRNDSEK